MVDDTHYRRTVSMGNRRGWIEVSMTRGDRSLNVEVSPSLEPVTDILIPRIKRLFDLEAAPDAISKLLLQDARLKSTVRRLPGLRVAGAFDGFELAVRTVLGQQVSVKAASTVAGRWAQAFGTPIATPFAQLKRLTPSAKRMAGVPYAEICALGVVGARARCLVALAEAVVERRVDLDFTGDAEDQIQSLMQVTGIGPWTAQYIAMRALHWHDAFPSGDLMLMRAANADRRQLQELAEAWRPWRAYAAHYLWQSLGVPS
jgi:AraC family transcriptional regulator of adaptative response / DNA-3-methyladenine glycosylase II